MAYLNFLGSVPEEQISTLRRNANTLLRPTLIVAVSHLTAYWIRVQPIGDLLGEALDGGHTLSDRFTHPLRDPIFHRPAEVRTLQQKLTDAFQNAEANPQSEEDLRSWRHEIGQVLRIFTHASHHGECVVSAMEGEGQGVRMPFAMGTEVVDEPGVIQSGGDLIAGQKAEILQATSLFIGGWAPAAAGVIAGAFGLCYWRYRRMRDRRIKSSALASGEENVGEACRRNAANP